MYIIQGDDKMKITKIVYKIMIIIAVIIMCSSSICFAGVEDGKPNLELDYGPTVQMGESSMNIVETILGVLTVSGIAIGIVGIALIGFNSILGSASEKAAGKEKYVGIVIAALLITGGSVIAKLLINFAENLV